jgi:aminopeptidase N
MIVVFMFFLQTFFKGLQNYLKTYQYSNAETKDLWAALSKASGQDVELLMNGFAR